MDKFNVLDLFCGAGGLSRGFLDAGYNVVLGIDYDDMALKTFKCNHLNADAMKLDLYNHQNINEIEKYFLKKELTLDVLVGGPPCQGFSLAGNRNIDDKRNSLYTAMVKVAEKFKPKAVVLENVPGLLELNNGYAAKRIISDFSRLGYTMTVKILYAPDFGIPQIRKRAFFVGLLNSKDAYVFPSPVMDKTNYVTCEEAIGDLPALEGIVGDKVQNYEIKPFSDYQKLMRKHSKKIYNHEGTIHDAKTIKFISMVPEGKNYKSLPPMYKGLYKYHEALTRYHSKKPSNTINTGHRSHFHYKYNRIPTVRESARLQSFPDDFIFYGNKSQQYRQVGNAVPPMLGYHVAKKLLESLTNNSGEKYKVLDLFSGCGGLTEGFLQTGKYKEIASVDWLKPQVDTLRKRLQEKWHIENVNESVMWFDIQREKELFHGWENDEIYGNGKGLDYFVNEASGIDVIIGGPPCQAYSIAGRVRDEDGMKNDYRNFLFEHYLEVVRRYRPKVFVFENVPGLLSAKPNGLDIKETIRKSFKSVGYEIIDNLNKTQVNAVDYGVPQNRKRLIIVGVNKKIFSNIQYHLNRFYDEILPKYKVPKKKTIYDAIGDLPPCYPLYDEKSHKQHQSHSEPLCSISWHIPRYANLRDMDTFRLLAEDIESGEKKYDSVKISELYEKKIGSKSPIHRYHVLEPDKPSTTILAHLHKDGNRFIHYDSQQCRTITVREAARIQSFPDDFEFVGSQGNSYQMIGNAVPPLLAKAIASSVFILLNEMNG